MAEAIGKVMEDMSSSTQLKPMFRPRTENPIPQSLFLFVTSIARTNLEVELIQRGGSLVVSSTDSINPLLPKRDCIGKICDGLYKFFQRLIICFPVPLLHVLGVHARVARSLAMWPAWMTFQQLCGMPVKANTSIAHIEREVPLLLRDPTALLLQFILLLPLHLDISKLLFLHSILKDISCNFVYSLFHNHCSNGIQSIVSSNSCSSFMWTYQCRKSESCR